MRQALTSLLLLPMLVVPAWATRDIRMDQDYDPRIELRLIVAPATLERSLNRVNPRTVSALFATELLREYEVVDLARFEQYLQDRRFTLETAFTMRAESVVRDSAQIDAIADIEIYLWEQGQGGLPLLGRKSGKVGMRIRLVDPFTGRMYWSVNRVERVTPNADFLRRSTRFFRDLVTDLSHVLDRERHSRDLFDAGAGIQLTDALSDGTARNQSKFTGIGSRDRAFVAFSSPAERDLARRTRTVRPGGLPSMNDEKTALFPPLFEGGYEDIERVKENSSEPEGANGTTPGSRHLTGPPPLPATLRLDDITPKETPPPGNTR